MKRIALVAVTAALVVSACQSATEILTEQVLEQVDGVDNIEIDADSGQIKVETDEGSVTIGGGDLPESFAVALPDDYDVLSVFDGGDGSAVSVTYPDGDYEEIVAYFDAWTSGQPGDWSASTMSIEQGDAGMMRSASFSNDEISIAIIDCFDFQNESDELNAVCVTVLSG